ncbi:MAG: hypothetical protein P9L98_05150 [Candidatus Kaelpia imicola]|nr:hypothetical protein [Candidatus Kaelpia imicola]
MKVLSKRNIIYYVGCFLSISLLFCCFFLSYSEGNEFSQDKLISAVLILTEQWGSLLDKEQLIEDIEKLTPLKAKASKESFIVNIVRAVRKQGVFLEAFALESKDITKLKENKTAFISLLKNGDLCYVVKNIEIKNNKAVFSCILPDRKEIFIDERDFFSCWEGMVISKPLVNIKAKRLLNKEGDNKFVALYFYHSGEDFNLLRKVLEKLKEEAERTNKKLIYIDELGLIPERSIESYMKVNQIGEKEAFELIKKMLNEDISNVGKGVAILGETNPFYRQLYQYLAKNKIESYMEDLRYDAWKKIVVFDSMEYYSKAINYFFFNNIDKYIKSIERFIEGYWEYNIKRRDDDFRSQIKKIVAKHPNSLIFTIRGIGHYGMDNDINLDNLAVETLVFGRGIFEDNLLHSQMYYILLSNDIVMKENDKKLAILKTYFEDTLRAYFVKKGLNIPEATQLVCKISKRLKEKNVLKFSQAIYYAVIKQPEQLQEMWGFTYNWFKNQGFIKEEDLKVFQN